LLFLVPLPGQASASFTSSPIPIGPLDFGSGPPGVVNDLSFQIGESGDSTLIISDPQLGGTNPGVFAVVTAFPISIADGIRAASIHLTCTPPSDGSFSAVLDLSTNDPSSPSVSYKLRCVGAGSGAAPVFSSTPTPPGPVAFGAGPVGLSNSQTIFVAEQGTASLTLQSPSLDGAGAAMYVLETAFPITVEDGGNPLGITLTCTPDLGYHLATLQLTTNDPSRPTVVFNLSCTGANQAATAGFASTPTPPGPIGIDPAPMGINVSRLVHVTEVGSTDLVLSNPQLAGQDPSSFFLATSFPLTIIEGSWGKTFQVGCSLLEPGVRSATLHLNTNDPTHATVSFTLLCGAFFADGFESGDTSQWLATVP